jgi:hypothetical protein
MPPALAARAGVDLKLLLAAPLFARQLFLAGRGEQAAPTPEVPVVAVWRVAVVEMGLAIRHRAHHLSRNGSPKKIPHSTKSSRVKVQSHTLIWYLRIASYMAAPLLWHTSSSSTSETLE